MHSPNSERAGRDAAVSMAFHRALNSIELLLSTDGQRPGTFWDGWNSAITNAAAGIRELIKEPPDALAAAWDREEYERLIAYLAARAADNARCYLSEDNIALLCSALAEIDEQRERGNDLLDDQSALRAAALSHAAAEGVAKGRQEMRKEVVEALWGRLSREEYGHAKAAVALDIEAVMVLPLRALPARAPGEMEKHDG